MSKIRCVICFEYVEENENVRLDCSHREFHLACLQRHFRQECPLCRKPHTIPVFGELPSQTFDFDMLDTEDYDSEDMQIIDGIEVEEFTLPPLSRSRYEFEEEDREFVKQIYEDIMRGDAPLIDVISFRMAIKRLNSGTFDVSDSEDSDYEYEI